MTPHTIYFVRHGETVWNTERRLQGRMDSPLTERGLRQARDNGTTLSFVPEIGGLHFVCSPLPRARATMEIIRDRLGLPHDDYEVDERLTEMNFGAWEGMTATEIRSNFPGEWEARQAQKWTHGVPGGETFAQVSLRLNEWASSLTEDVVVVAHGALGRVLRGLNLKLPEEEIAQSRDPLHEHVYRLWNGTEAVL